MDNAEIRRALELFCPNNQLFEIRALHVSKKKDIWSGFFKDYNKAIEAIQRFDNEYNIYFVFNVINDICYSMLQKDTMTYGTESIVDTDIIARNWILIDLDPIRGHKKISSTEEEWQLSRQRARDIHNFLRDMGFSYPVVCSSGNGFHLMYKIDNWANTEDNNKIVSDFLKTLSLLFSDDRVDIDIKVGNCARITKLYGTMARKGIDDIDRPHRLSKILVIPDEVKYTDKDFFLKINKKLPIEEKPTYENKYNSNKFDIDAFIAKYNIGVSKDVMINGTRKIILDECPFNSSHKSPDSAIFVSPNGIGFTCFHSSCAQYSWKDFRLHYDPEAYDKKDYAEYRQKQMYYSNYKHEPFVPQTEISTKGKKWLSMNDIKYVDIGSLISIPTGFEALDKKIVGLLLGELSVLSGISGSGKTSWLDCLALNVVQRGFKVAIWSGELQDFRFQGWIDQIAAGKNYVVKKSGYDNYYYCPKNISDKINNWLEDKMYLYNNQYGSKWQQIFDDIKKVVEEKGVQLLILDNLAALNIDGYDGEKYSKQTKFITDIKEYAKEKNVHIIIVAHPRKENSFLRKESVSGTTDLINIADSLFLLHRVGRDFEVRAGEFLGKDEVSNFMKYSTVLEVAKNRAFGVVDYIIGMYYEPESRRLKNSIEEHIIYGWQEEQSPLSYIPSNNNPIIEENPFMDINMPSPFM